MNVLRIRFHAVLALILAFVLVVPFKVQAEGFQWVELLDDQTVNSSGKNWFSYTSSTTFEVPTPMQMRVSAVDMLIACTNGTIPTKVEFYDGSSWVALNVTSISNGMARVFGTLTYTFYTSLKFRFTKSGSTTSTVEILSLKMQTLRVTEANATGAITILDNGISSSMSTGTVKYLNPSTGAAEPRSFQINANYSNAYVYDYLTLFGYVDYASITSIRAVYGTTVLPYDVNFIDVNSSMIWNASDFDTAGYGLYYFSITVDLSQIDRAAKNTCQIIISGDYSSAYGMAAKIESFKGGFLVPDNSGVSNWNRFTTFMTGLFSDLGTTLGNLGPAITAQTQTLVNSLNSIWTEVEDGFANVGTWFTAQTNAIDSALTSLKNALVSKLNSIWTEIEDGFTNVGSWLNQGFTNIGSWITTQTSTLKTELTNMKTALNNTLTGFWSDVEEGFVSVGSWFRDQTEALVVKLTDFQSSVSHGISLIGGWFEQYFGQDTAEADDFVDDAGDQGDQISDLNDQLQDVIKPDVGDLDLGVSGYADPDTANLINTSIRQLVSNSLIVTMFSITLTVSLVSFVLFGKR